MLEEGPSQCRRQEPETQAQRKPGGHAGGNRRLERELGHPQVAPGPWKEALSEEPCAYKNLLVRMLKPQGTCQGQGTMWMRNLVEPTLHAGFFVRLYRCFWLPALSLK